MHEQTLLVKTVRVKRVIKIDCNREIRIKDLTGRTFGRLRVLGLAERPPKGNSGYFWRCQCACGSPEKDIRGADMIKDKNPIRSCGCIRAEGLAARRRIHGESQGTGPRAKEYVAWKIMIRRCENTNTPDYPYYGGRGIQVSPLWRHDFEAFFAHIGPAPSSKHTVDRKDTNGHYEPGNVRWATRKEQRANQRTMTA